MGTKYEACWTLLEWYNICIVQTDECCSKLAIIRLFPLNKFVKNIKQRIGVPEDFRKRVLSLVSLKMAGWDDLAVLLSLIKHLTYYQYQYVQHPTTPFLPVHNSLAKNNGFGSNGIIYLRYNLQDIIKIRAITF